MRVIRSFPSLGRNSESKPAIPHLDPTSVSACDTMLRKSLLLFRQFFTLKMSEEAYNVLMWICYCLLHVHAQVFPIGLHRFLHNRKSKRLRLVKCHTAVYRGVLRQFTVYFHFSAVQVVRKTLRKLVWQDSLLSIIDPTSMLLPRLLLLIECSRSMRKLMVYSFSGGARQQH